VDLVRIGADQTRTSLYVLNGDFRVLRLEGE
jgi:hypothetical protein